MSSIYDWSTTPGSNTSVGGVNIAEGMSPALVNDAIRMAMAIIRQSFDASLQNFLNNSAALPVANGGTGATTAPTALTALNALDASFRDINPIVKSSGWTFADSERGRGLQVAVGAAALTATIDPNSTTSITNGAVYPIVNFGAGALTVARGSGVTLYKNGSATSSDAVLAVGGQATLIRWGTDVWTINGSGIS